MPSNNSSLSLLEQMSELYDAHLLQVLQEGREIVTKEGEVERVQPTAADLNVIRQRLKDCGITSAPTATNPIGNIVAEMTRRGMQMPGLDDADDAATA